MNEYLSVLKNYAKFDGRARRREYWMFTLVNAAVYVVLNILATQVSMYIGYLAIAYMLGILVPSIAVAIRRMHDIGKSGWWVLIALVPLIGGIWFSPLRLASQVQTLTAQIQRRDQHQQDAVSRVLLSFRMYRVLRMRATTSPCSSFTSHS